MTTLITVPTAGRELKVVTHYPGHHDLTAALQRMADDGWDFIGKIGEYRSTGIALSTEDYLFVRDKKAVSDTVQPSEERPNGPA